MITDLAPDARQLDDLLRHHPEQVRPALEQGLSPHLRWRQRPDGPVRTALWHALALSTPDAVAALYHRGSEMIDQEKERVGTLPVAVVHLSRNPPEGSPLHALSEADRHARETALIKLLSTLTPHPLLGKDPGEVPRLAARLRLPATTLRGLMAHGMDLNAPVAQTVRTTPLHEMVAHGDASDLERWLALGWDPAKDLLLKTRRWGSTLQADGTQDASRPHDGTVDDLPAARADQAALHVIRWALPRPDETTGDRVARVDGMLDMLRRHGWTPGPTFLACALGVAASNAQAPALFQALVQRWGAHPNGQDQQGRNALHYVTRLPQGLDGVPVLLEMGVSPHQRNLDGDTPIDAARDYALAFPPAGARYAAAVQAMENIVLRDALDRSMSDGVEPLPATPRARL